MDGQFVAIGLTAVNTGLLTAIFFHLGSITRAIKDHERRLTKMEKADVRLSVSAR